MNKLLLLGIFVLAIGIGIAALAFKMLPDGTTDLATGAVTGTPDAEDTIAEKAGSVVDFSKIQEDMTEKQVTAIAGKPLEKQASKTAKGSDIEYWYYEQGKDVWQIGMSEGKVSVVRKY